MSVETAPEIISDIRVVDVETRRQEIITELQIVGPIWVEQRGREEMTISQAAEFVETNLRLSGLLKHLHALPEAIIHEDPTPVLT